MKNIMDNRTKTIFAIFLLSVLLVTFFVYKKYFLDKDYPVYAEVPCDPVTEVCFVYHCDSETDECTGVAEEDTTYYKKIERSAASFPSCDPNEEACTATSCDGNDVGCIVTFCDSTNEEAECSFPEDFQIIGEEFDLQESVEMDSGLDISSAEGDESQTSLEE